MNANNHQSHQTCFHCQLPFTAGCYSVQVNDQSVDTCCPGCQAACQMINDFDLFEYYDARDNPTASAISSQQSISDFSCYDNANIQQQYVSPRPNIGPNVIETSLLIDNLFCTACSWLIEQTLRKTSGIQNCVIDSQRKIVVIRWHKNQISFSKILNVLFTLGYKAKPIKPDDWQDSLKKRNSQFLLRLGLSGIGAMQVMMLSIGLYVGAVSDLSDAMRDFMRSINFLITTPIMLYAGKPFLENAWNAVRNKIVSMDLIISIAIMLAYITSIQNTSAGAEHVYYDTICMFIFFITLSRYIEFRAYFINSNPQQTLRDALPDRVQTIELINGLQQKIVKHRDDLKKGDTVIVLSNSVIPFDSILLSAHTQVSEAFLTGESQLLLKSKGDLLFAGSSNHGDDIQTVVTQTSNSSRFAHIDQIIQDLPFKKSAIQELSQKFATRFLGLLLPTTAVTYCAWLWLDSISGNSQATQVALAMLIVTCPCALAISVPAALARASKLFLDQGILVSDPNAVYALQQATDIIFDKTGTLTENRSTLDAIHCYTETSEQEALSIAAAMELGIQHPIAQLFIPHLTDFRIDEQEFIIGKGVKARMNHQDYFLGNPEFINDYLPDLNIQNIAPSHKKSNCIYLANHNKLIAHFEISSTLRQGNKAMVKNLQDMGINLHLLSGDKAQACQQLGELLAIDHIASEHSPEQKLDYLKALKQQDKTLLFVGDGINDIPAMEFADASIAVDSDIDLTKSKADIFMQGESLADLPKLLKISQQTKNIIKQNLWWSLSYNLLAIPLAACAILPPYLAAIGMSISSILVTINTLRIKPN